MNTTTRLFDPLTIENMITNINNKYRKIIIEPARENEERKKSYDESVKKLSENKGGGY